MGEKTAKAPVDCWLYSISVFQYCRSRYQFPASIAYCPRFPLSTNPPALQTSSFFLFFSCTGRETAVKVVVECWPCSTFVYHLTLSILLAGISSQQTLLSALCSSNQRIYRHARSVFHSLLNRFVSLSLQLHRASFVCS